MSELIRPNGRPLQMEPPPPEPIPFIPMFCLGEDENGRRVDPPRPETEGSAGYDIQAAKSMTLEPGKTTMVPTSVRMAIPPGIYGQLCSRSGLGVKHGLRIAQGVGVIDSDYRGEVFVALHNDSEVSYEVTCGDRIAQLLFLPYAVITFQITTDPSKLPESPRGAGGFGSTGT